MPVCPPASGDGHRIMNAQRAILVALLGALLFLSPLVIWVAHLSPAWWWPFAAWVLFIVTIAALTRRERRDP
ncbi:hypothetical protein [Thioalkalivibrio sp. AKL19]|uniref:hypothetical protein n=1 Tax=Thioalkalivibrio sp. AKL19 TaxID=1266914 RepID=UPI00041AF8EF|nr:hypothetical protein [Thioalkalivibrio sp. AKL19]